MKDWQHLQSKMDSLIPTVTEQGLRGICAKDQILYLVWSYYAAVTNGGHAGFYFNPGGEYALETLSALKQIGADNFAKILDRTIELFPDREVPKDLDERLRPFEEMTEEQFNAMPEDPGEILETADSEFFRLGDEALVTCLYSYLESKTE